MFKWILLSCLGFFLVACSQAPTSAERDISVEQVGTITEIDRDARRVVMRLDGRMLTLRVAEGVEEFDTLEEGDRIRFAYEEAVAVRMALPGEADATGTDTATALAIASGATDAGGAEASRFSATFLAYDQRTKTAQLTLADGTTLSVFVNRELRSFAQARSPGDEIVIESTSNRLVSVEKQS